MSDPTILDGRGTTGLSVDKTNWINMLDAPFLTESLDDRRRSADFFQ
ncbi:MAG: hypothetical protein IIA11_08375 [Proteobacteria bacterium]|nr:hypothetical protein [Pseudomonadota bacterium]